MKIAGIIFLAIGLLLGVYSLNMDVGVDVPAKNYGYGVETPAMRVANIDQIEQRRNLNMLSGALIIGGILLVGFSALAKKDEHPAGAATPPRRSHAPKEPAAESKVASKVIAVAICPKCRSMYSDGETSCRCGHEFA